MILIGGGLFLIAKATHEILAKPRSRGMIVLQIVVIDLVFSLDSVITAVGMVDNIWIMVAAMVIAMGVMLFAATTISEFVERHPTVKVLALSFLLLIGVVLVADGFAQHINKGYIYFAMAFALFVEILKIRGTKRRVADAPG